MGRSTSQALLAVDRLGPQAPHQDDRARERGAVRGERTQVLPGGPVPVRGPMGVGSDCPRLAHPPPQTAGPDDPESVDQPGVGGHPEPNNTRAPVHVPDCATLTFAQAPMHICLCVAT
eukprot:10163503-Alexandrium_andersonii.AAC.1